MYIIPESRHRDGSMYKATNSGWKEFYDIVNRNETRLDAMMLSDPTDCYISDGICITHPSCGMLQIFSVKLAKLYLDGGSVELYGYIAARDALDALLNYVVNVSRDDPIVVEQTGNEGKRILQKNYLASSLAGITLAPGSSIEFDMRIKTGEEEKDDLQLIDGASEICGVPLREGCTWTERIHGDYGAIELTAAYLQAAVEATVQVLVSEVHSSFNLCLSCFIRGLDEELRLFDGSIGESCGLKRFVVAVTQLSWMDLKFKVGAESSGSTEHWCSFKSYYHGHATREMKTGFGLISVKLGFSSNHSKNLINVSQ
ncbi:hypothetical protein BRADI_2g59278v3 [Brachypodium distachyon]|uniref:DUF6598 domain-containing protein n=1 Tax=Brachypodium distachyon TaxID=15368 RepID=A0A2K2DGV2_BRADI|nr:hypothetical protein BRADI_2g59278v3 [Brachypodium distachyon]